MVTKLVDLIEKVNADDLPTNEFTIEDKDPMVILGKLNEVIAYLEQLQATINSSDTKANEALQKAIQAVADATQALSVANGIDDKATQALANAVEAVSTANSALSASNTALSTANTAISTANTALSSAKSAVETAESAETNADTAISTANGAKTTAEGIDSKVTQALANSQTAITTANNADSKADSAVATAEDALNQVVAGLGTKVYRDTTLLNNLDIKPIEDDIANNTIAITALQNGKVDKVAGKQLSTEDFTTNEKNKLAGLNNYDDTQVQADITALQTSKANQSDLSATNNNVATNTTNIATNTSDINNLKTSKANNDLSNVTYPQVAADGNAKTGAGDRVIESKIYSNGTTWYRKWASGWKECGMFYQSSSISLSSGSGKDLGLIELPITFSNTNYNVQCTTTWTASGGNQFVFDTVKTYNTNNSIFLVVTRIASSGSASPACFITCAGY